MAPGEDIGCAPPPLSTFITARIQRAGTAKRPDASSMNSANRSMDSERGAVCAPALDSKTVKAAAWHMNGAMAAMTRAMVWSERRQAIGSAVARVWLFRCEPAERFPTDEHGRQGKIRGGLGRPHSGEG